MKIRIEVAVDVKLGDTIVLKDNGGKRVLVRITPHDIVSIDPTTMKVRRTFSSLEQALDIYVSCYGIEEVIKGGE